jgi:hypothetical protein
MLADDLRQWSFRLHFPEANWWYSMALLCLAIVNAHFHFPIPCYPVAIPRLPVAISICMTGVEEISTVPRSLSVRKSPEAVH